jgi:hypothetical protein
MATAPISSSTINDGIFRIATDAPEELFRQRNAYSRPSLPTDGYKVGPGGPTGPSDMVVHSTCTARGNSCKCADSCTCNTLGAVGPPAPTLPRIRQPETVTAELLRHARSGPMFGRQITEVIDSAEVTLEVKCEWPAVRNSARDASTTLGMT